MNDKTNKTHNANAGTVNGNAPKATSSDDNSNPQQDQKLTKEEFDKQEAEAVKATNEAEAKRKSDEQKVADDKAKQDAIDEQKRLDDLEAEKQKAAALEAKKEPAKDTEVTILRDVWDENGVRQHKGTSLFVTADQAMDWLEAGKAKRVK